MKLKALVFAAAAAALTTTTAFAATQAFRVNGDLITKTEQEDMIKAATARGQQRTEELENQVKQLLTQQSVLVQEAKKQRLDRKSDVRRAIERARESILMQALVEDYLKKNPVPESDVRALFDAEKKRWGDTEVQVSSAARSAAPTSRRITSPPPVLPARWACRRSPTCCCSAR